MNQPSMKPDQVVSTLNSLIELNRDAQKGFQEAAEKIDAPQIKTFCFEQSRSRAQFVGELQTLVHSLGDEPDNTGTVSGALQRGWMDLKSALGGGDRAILAATETSEDHAVNAYKKALAKTLPSDVRDIVERQFQSVQQAHDKVKTLRDSLGK
ncbi:PA2169 family four-helix-bundle protein [Rhodoferax sp. UBA5149]|uniref:PA2169 family four-helix-bundle protein n=1 Tax=Rhodoferax sp. UBA5149 TaxID=1947379 RepID=UPI0025CF1C5F|nr:PA2169 family four-helix-bundle protein [Rhodoferax sp. UBA5149]